MSVSASRLARASVAVALSMALALLIVPALAPQAHAQPITGAISGTVRLPGGAPMAGCNIEVRAYSDGSLRGETTTDGAGFYTVANLGEGQYAVHFMPGDNVHQNQWYNGKTDEDFRRQTDLPDPVTVTPPDTTQNINAALVRGASISGRVTSTAGGVPVTSCLVHAHILRWNTHGWSTEKVGTDAVDSNGYYKVGALESAPYLVEFEPTDDVHAGEWYNDKQTSSSATRLYLTAPNETKSINAVLAAGGRIRGSVRSSTGTALYDHPVYLRIYDNSSKTWVPYSVGENTTDSAGYYSLGPVAPGKYKVYFGVPAGTKSHFPEWYDDKQSEDEAAQLSVAAGETKSNINAVLAKTCFIVGRVTRDCGDNEPIPGVLVTAYMRVGNNWEVVAEEKTDGNGDYYILGLKAGTYRVKYTSPRTAWSSTWYNGKGSLSSATNVPLEIYETRRINLKLKWSNNTPYAVFAGNAFNDYGEVLTGLNLPFEPFSAADLQDGCLLSHYRYLFMNCTNELHDWDADPSVLQQFVNGGGYLFTSDFAGFTMLNRCFPGHVTFADPVEQGTAQKLTGAVIGPSLSDYLGKDATPLVYDQGGWSVINGTQAGTSILIRGNVHTENTGTLANRPLLVSFAHGSGKVFYSTFHESKQGELGKQIVSYYLAQGAARGSWYLAEGSTDGGTETWLTIQNPNTLAANVSVTYMGPGGVTWGPTLAVPGKSRASVQVSKTIRDYQVSTRVSSESPIVVERSMYGNNNAWGTDSIGVVTPSATWYLAEGSTNGGMETWITVQNPNTTDTKVSLTYMTPSGAVPGPSATVKARTRMSFYTADTVPNVWDVSTKVTSDLPVVAERSMYGNGKTWATNSIGVVNPSTAWYLAEGSTNGGMETWITVQNPNSTDAKVSLTYMTPSGSVKGPSTTIKANTRKSFYVADTVPNVWDVSTKVTSDRPVVAERSMYGNGKTWATNSIGVVNPSTAWYLAEGSTNGGMETWITVQNPNSTDAKVSLTYMTPSGSVKGPSTTIKANTRKSFYVADTVPNVWDVSTRVGSDWPVVAERSMYGNGKSWATNSIGYSP